MFAKSYISADNHIGDAVNLSWPGSDLKIGQFYFKFSLSNS